MFLTPFLPMPNWLLETFIGLDPPILTRGLRSPLSHTKQIIPESECCSITLLSMDIECAINAYIETSHAHIPVTVVMGEPIIMFSCFDTLHLSLLHIAADRMRVYSLSLSGCRNWEASSFKAHEIGLFGKHSFIETGTSSVEVAVRIQNLRQPGEYHYFVQESKPRAPQLCQAVFLNHPCRIEPFRCVFCLRIFPTLAALTDHHSTIHPSYSITHSTTHSAGDGVWTIRDTGCSEDARAEACKSACKPPAEHSSDSDGAARKRIRAEGDHPSDEQTNDLRRYSFAFGRRRKDSPSPLLYRLRSHRLLIEAEYDRLDYSESIAAHANGHIGELESETALAVAMDWNSRRVYSQDIHECLHGTLSRFGLIKETVQLLGILYKGGLLNSTELMAILSRSVHRPA